MEEFKGTRGPWVASKSDRSIGPVIKDDDQSYGMILPVAWVEFDGKPGHHQANANLIAASPELFESLKCARLVIEKLTTRGSTRTNCLAMIDAALIKALGQ